MQITSLEKSYTDLTSQFIYNAIPVIEQIKPAVLWNITNRKMIFMWKKRHLEIMKHYPGLNWIILYEKKQFLTIFVYRKDLLHEVLSNMFVQEFLVKFGYGAETSLNTKLKILIKRYNIDQYPHEIGVFLGYPLMDVIGFMKNHGKNYKISRYWKVYDNVEYSLSMFQKIDKAKQKVLQTNI